MLLNKEAKPMKTKKKIMRKSSDRMACSSENFIILSNWFESPVHMPQKG